MVLVYPGRGLSRWYNEAMFVLFLGWWYGDGWRLQLAHTLARLGRMTDAYSFRLLAATLFSPFRQISAGRVEGPIGLQLRAWLDRLISRFIGAGIRLVVMAAGGIVLLVVLLAGLVQLVVWPLLPLAPVIGVVLWLNGWLPWTM